jgi:hypothetical protein
LEKEYIYFFRLRFFDRPQGQLFDRSTKEQLLENAFANKQLAFETHGSRWRFGNYAPMSNSINYFRVGKVKTEKNERFIEGDFDEEILEKGVSTKVMVDIDLGLLAIYQNWELAQHPATIATRILEILQSDKQIERNGYLPVVDQLRDPRDFIAMIERAIAVKAVEINFKGRNPRDVGLIFHRQLEESVDMLRGNEGQTKISGDYLDKSMVIDIARSTAQTGDSVSAKIQENGAIRATWKHMNKSNFLFIEVASNDPLSEIISQIYNTYKNIKNDN